MCGLPCSDCLIPVLCSLPASSVCYSPVLMCIFITFCYTSCTIHHCETSLPYTRHSTIVCKAGFNNVTHIKLRLITHHTTLFFISLKAPRHVISYTTLTCFLLVYLCILLRSLTWSVEYVSLKQYGLTFGVWYVSILTLSIVPPLPLFYHTMLIISKATVNWYAVISVNVLINLHNPFVSTHKD